MMFVKVIANDELTYFVLILCSDHHNHTFIHLTNKSFNLFPHILPTYTSEITDSIRREVHE